MPRLLSSLILCCALPSLALSQTATSLALSTGGATTLAYGGTVTLTATLTSGTPAATGVVTFYDSQNIVGYGTLSGNQAAFSTRLLLPGVHKLYARYQGSVTYGISTSNTVNETVTGPKTAELRPSGLALPAVTTPGQMIHGDFNGDGIIDLAVVSGNGSVISVLRGVGDGTFAAATNIPVPPPSLSGSFSNISQSYASLAAVDYDGNGFPDIVVAQGYSATYTNPLSSLNGSTLNGYQLLYFPGGAGGVSSTSTIIFSQQPSVAVISILDSVSDSYLLFNGLAAADYLQTGLPASAVATSHANTTSVFNGVSFSNATSTSNQIVVVDHSGATHTTALSGQPNLLVGADLAGTGSPDVVVSFGTAFTPFRNVGNGSGTFSTQTQLTAAGFVNAIAVSDLDTNGVPDLAVGWSSTGGPQSGGLEVFFGSSPGSYGAAAGALSNTFGVFDVTIADVNGDGFPDILADDDNASVYVLLGSRNGLFTAAGYSPVAQPAPAGLSAADFNGDGRVDLAVSLNSNNQLGIFLGDVPLINSLTPSSTLVSATSPSVTVAGPYFAANDTVTVGGTGAAVTAHTSSSLTITVPPQALQSAGSVPVVVTDTATGVSSAITNLTVLPKPSLTSLTPSFTTVNSSLPGNTLTITGTNLPLSPKVTWLFNGVSTNLTVTGTPAPTAITATVPNGVNGLLGNAGTASVTVTDIPSGVSSNSLPFIVAAGPVITNLGQSSVGVGSPAFTLTINGANFASGDIVVWTPSGSGVTPTQIQGASLSIGSGGTVILATVNSTLLQQVTTAAIQVVDSNGTSSGIASFQVAAPVIGPIVPSGATVGTSSPVTLNISGSNFVPNSAVNWCNACTSPPGPAPIPTTYISSTQLTATVLPSLLANPATVNVSVSNVAGQFSGSQVFTIGTLNLSNIVPTSVSAGSPGFTLNVVGSNFTASSVVTLTIGSASQTLTTTFISSTLLQAAVPMPLLTAAGQASVSVQVGAAVSNSTSLTVVGPTVTNVSPTTSPTGAGSFPLKVTGANFLAGSVVQWANGTAAAQPLSTSFQDANDLVAIVPQALVATAGTALINVLNPGGSVSTGVIFTVGPSPSINVDSTGLNPGSAAVGSPAIQITVQGANYQNGSVVTWNNSGTITNLPTGFVSSTSLTATISAALLNNSGSAVVAVQNPGAVNSNGVVFTIQPGVTPSIAPPLVPSSALAGGPSFQLIVTGGNFVPGSQIQWNSGSSTTTLATSLANGQLSALVPNTLITTAGTAFVSVLNPGGGAASPVLFTIDSNQPTISPGGLNPSSVPIASPSFQLTLTGTNFVTGSQIQWNGGSGAQALPTAYVSPTSLTAIVPASYLSASGTALVSVGNPGGASSNSALFSITPAGAPVISSTGGLSPASATPGGAAFLLTITGSNFFSGSQVQWNGGSTPQTLPASFIGSSQLSVLVPASLIAGPGTAFVSVTNPGGVASNSVAFTITPVGGPAISAVGGLSPATVPAGNAAFQLDVGGTNFQSGAVVQWSAGAGIQPLTTGFTSPTSLFALVPASLVAAPGIAFITVLNPDKGLSNTVSFTVAGSIPVLTQLAPASAAAGSQGFALSLSGTGFAAGSIVMWGATPLPTTFVSATQLNALIGAAQLTTAGSVSVTVQSPGGTSNAVNFTVGLPVITLINPDTVTTGAPGFTLTVAGSNFVSGSVINFGGTALATTFVSPTQLTGAVAASLLAMPNSVNVTVANPGGIASAPYGFSVGPVPNIQTLAPASASPGSPAFTLTVTGANFASGDTVQWNGVALVTTFGSATSLSAAVPATLLTGSGSVNVSVLHGGGVVSNAVQFTLTAATLTSISPTSAPAGSPSLQLTVVGTAFVNGSTVQWNGTAVPTTFVSATQLTATVDTSLLQAVGNAFVVVANPGGSATPGTKFTVAGPTLTSISPASAIAGAAGLALTLTGTNFVNNSAASWNGTPLPTTVASATQAAAQVPSSLLAAAGSFVVLVTNPGGSATAGQFFTLNAPTAPAVSTVSPVSAIAGGAAFQLTVTGSGFVSGSTIQWNGAALATNFGGPAQLTALVDSSLIVTAGTANITVQVPGAPVSTTTKFPINPPAVTTLSPATANAGGPAFSLTVTGGNFLAGSSVQWNGAALPTIFNSATQLTASVAAGLIASGGTAGVTVQNPGGASSAPSTFTIGPFTLSITTATLPDAVVGAPYSQILAATGGSPPYTWTVTAGTLPSGLTIDGPTGTLSGTATAALTSAIGFTVTDSVSRAVTRSIAVRAVAPLTITTTTPLNNAVSGTVFSQILAATGGTAPYTWSVTGALPAGLTLNASTGQIGGTSSAPGAYNFTIGVVDTRQQSASAPVTLTVTAGNVTITGLAATSTSAQQVPISVTVASPYPTNLTGTLTLVFTSSAGAGDPSIQFSTGGATADFSIPAGTTQAVFGQQQSVLLLTGTVAGTITVTASVQAGGVSVTPATAPQVMTTVGKEAPVITSAALAAAGSSLVVSVTGFSNTREITQGNFLFNAAAGSTLNSAPITVNLASLFSGWYQSAASANFGSQFTVSIPFNFTGSLAAVGSVTVSLVNTQGTSAAVTATRQ